jgi:ATP/maltotriose-dependent transcriptional regulator MalT
VDKLTETEIKIMILYSNPYLEKSYICSYLSISLNTLNWHINNIFSKLGENERFAASFKFFRDYPEHRPLIDKYIAQAS